MNPLRAIEYTTVPLLAVSVVALLGILWLLVAPRLVRRRRERLREQPFPAAWREILRRNVPYLRRLPADLRQKLRKNVQVFLAEKAFVGCGGLVVTEEMRVTIAAQACLLILNRGTDCYPNLRQVLVYPGAFVVDRLQTDVHGVLQAGRRVLAGESWQQGQVILSWEDVLEGAAVVDDGRNVVIHEFAHQLDQENGRANGAPILARHDRYRQWSQVLSEEFGRLQRKAEDGEESLFSHYGATNPAEFFAVASEVFFEQSGRMAAEHPALHAELCGFYRVNPQSW